MRINLEVRAAILKYISENPGSVSSQIIKAVNLEPRNGAKLLKKMAEQGILNRHDIVVSGVDSRGHEYTNKSFEYSVTGAVEISPEGTRVEPGYYMQRGGGWKANERASGGGQGSGRSRVYVGSSAGLL